MKKRLITWLLIFGGFSAVGLLLISNKYLDDLARGRAGTLPQRVIEELTAVSAMALLFPLLLYVARRYPLQGAHWLRHLTVHIAVLPVFSVVHTTMNWASRHALFPLFGLGAYDYGKLPWRYPMEFTVDVLAWSLLVAFIHLFDHYRAARVRALQLAQLETQLVRAQLQNLRLQLQPHFLFNALNTISSVIYEDVRTADRMIARLSDFLRLTLRHSEAQEVTLRQELEYLELYLEIMRARFEDRLSVGFAVAPETLEALTPQLLLQPLVENSIKHAANPATGAVNIQVRARRENGSLWLEVGDDGPGLIEFKEGLGLANTAERLQQLYGAAQSLTLENGAAGGLVVQVKLPFQTARLQPKAKGGAAHGTVARHGH